MPIRNPFTRRSAPLQQDENQRPGSAGSKASTTTDAAHPGFERVDTVGSKASPAFSIRSGSRRSQDTGEYKMSVVNDSGVYLPPSPIEREGAWPRRYLARTSSDRSSNGGGGSGGSGEIEHFPISRESFDSYRRSFDISAKSPVVATAAATTLDALPPRQSLDSLSSRRYHHHHQRSPPFLSSTSMRFPRSSLSESRWDSDQPPTPEESEREEGVAEGPYDSNESGQQGISGSRFEDVGLGNEEGEGSLDGVLGQQQYQGQQQQKKKGFFFAKFGSASSDDAAGLEESGGAPSGTAMSRFLPLPFGGAKNRAQSGGGALVAELGVMPAAARQAQEVEG